MSYITDTIQCSACKKFMNVAFGISGMTLIAQWPEECGFCGHKGEFIKHSAGWNADGEGNLKV